MAFVMRVLLRDRVTGLFYAGTNGWVAKQSDAWDCLELERAVRLRRINTLSETEIMLAYDHPGLRSPFNGKGRVERQQLAACYRGPVPDLGGALLEISGAVPVCVRSPRLLRSEKQRRKAA